MSTAQAGFRDVLKGDCEEQRSSDPNKWQGVLHADNRKGNTRINNIMMATAAATTTTMK